MTQVDLKCNKALWEIAEQYRTVNSIAHLYCSIHCTCTLDEAFMFLRRIERKEPESLLCGIC